MSDEVYQPQKNLFSLSQDVMAGKCQEGNRSITSELIQDVATMGSQAPASLRCHFPTPSSSNRWPPGKLPHEKQ